MRLVKEPPLSPELKDDVDVEFCPLKYEKLDVLGTQTLSIVTLLS